MKRSVVAVRGVVGTIGTIGLIGLIGLIASLSGGCSGSSSNKAVGGSGTGGAPGTGGSPATGGGPGTACNDYVAKYCARAQACDPGELTLAGFTSLADCETDSLQYCNDSFAAPHTGETVALLQQCGDGIEALSCTDFLQEGLAVPACRPQGGTIAIGGPCNNDWQCASGVCWWLSPDSCGMCATVTSVGQPCQVDATLGALCPDDLLCALTPTGGFTAFCSAPVPIGGACAQTEVCPGNAYCDPTTNVCTQLPALGEACDGSAVIDCDPTQTASICDGSTCVAASAVQEGQACNGFDLRCDGVCVNTNDAGVGTCHTFLPRGAACGTNDLCSFDTTCTAGVCASAVCGGAVSSGNDAAVAAALTPGRAFDRRRAVRLPQMSLGAVARPRR